MADNGTNDPRQLPALAAAFAEMTAARTAPEAIRSMTFRVVKKGGFDTDDVTSYLDRLAGDVEQLHDRIKELQERAPDGGPFATTGLGTLATTGPAAPAVEAPALEPPPVELQLPSPPSADAFGETASRIAELMRTFDENVRAAEEAARAEADAIVAKARGEAEDLRLEARLAREEAVADAASIVASARADADRLGREAQARAEELDEAAQRTVREARERADEVLRAMTLGRDGLVRDIREMREALADTLTRIDAMIAGGAAEDRLVVVDDPVDVGDDAATR